MITQKWMKPIGATLVALIMALAVVMALPVTRAVAEQTVTWSDPETVDFENYAVGGAWAAGSGYADDNGSTVTITDTAGEVISGSKSLKIVKGGTSADGKTYNANFLSKGKKAKITFKVKFADGTQSLDFWIDNWSKGYFNVSENAAITYCEQNRDEKNIDQTQSNVTATKDANGVITVSFISTGATSSTMAVFKPLKADNTGTTYIDDIEICYAEDPEPAYVPVFATANSVALNLAETDDVKVYTSASLLEKSIQTVTLGNISLTAEQYSLVGDDLVIKRSVFANMQKGNSQNLVVTTTDGLTATTVVKAYRFAVDAQKTPAVHDFESFDDGTGSFAAGSWDTGAQGQERGKVQSDGAISGEKSLYVGAGEINHYSFTNGSKSRISLKLKFVDAGEIDIAGGDWKYGQIVLKKNQKGYEHNEYTTADGHNINAPIDAVDLSFNEQTQVYSLSFTNFAANLSCKIFKANIIGGGILIDDVKVEYELGLVLDKKTATVNKLVPEDLAIETNIDVLGAEIASVKMDGTALAADNYTVSGRGTITVKKEYLKTLTTGNHTLTVTDSLTNEATVAIEVPALALRAMKQLNVNLSDDRDILVYHEAADILSTISGVSVDGTALDAQLYSLEGNAVKMRASAFTGKTTGKVTLTATDEQNATYTVDVPYKTYRFAIDETKTSIMDFENYNAGDQWGKHGWGPDSNQLVITDTAGEAIDGKSLRIALGSTNAYRDNCFATNTKTLISFDLRFVDTATYLQMGIGGWNGYVRFYKDGTVHFYEQSGANLVFDQNTSFASIAKDGDVYRCQIIYTGKSGTTQIIYNHDGAATIIDNIVGKFELGLGLVDSVMFDKDTPKDIVIPYNNGKLGTTIASVKLDGAMLVKDTDYTVAVDRIVLKKESLGALGLGRHTVVMTDSAGGTATTTVTVGNLKWDNQIRQGFDGLDSSQMTGGSASEGYIWSTFENLLSVEAAQADVTVSPRDSGLALQFVPTAAIGANSTYTMLATNGRKTTMILPGKEYKISFLYKGVGTSGFGVRILFFQSATASGLQNDIAGDMYTVSGDVSTGEIKASIGSGFKNDRKHPLSGSSIEALDDGWYRITVQFGFAEGDFNHAQAIAGKINAYFILQGVKSGNDSRILLDDVSLDAECFPYAREGDKLVFDIANQKDLQTVVHVHSGTYSLTGITDVTENTPVAVDGASYTVSNGEVIWKKEYLATLSQGRHTFEIATDKGNVVPVTVTVLDSSPVLTPTSAAFEKGMPEDLAIDIDFKGYTVDNVLLGGEMIDNVNWQINDAVTKLTFKRGYLLELETGAQTFTVVSSSGVTVEFTVTVVDSRPVFEHATASYDKMSNADLTVKLDLKGKTLVSVRLNGTTLGQDVYTVSDGNLTVAKAAFGSLNAGTYDLTVATDCGTATVELTVLDVPPTATVDTVEVNADTDLIITLDTKGRDIVSVVVGDFVLTAADYTFEDGKLTVKKEVISELAAGEKKVAITTTGGKVEVTFTVKAGGNQGDKPVPGDETPKSGCGCNGSMTAASLLSAVLLLVGCASLLRRRAIR